MRPITTPPDAVFPLDALPKDRAEIIFKTFWTSDLQGEKKLHGVFAIVTVKMGSRKCNFGAMNTPSQNPRNARTTKGKHAEEKVITFLAKALSSDSYDDGDSGEERVLTDVRKVFEPRSPNTKSHLTMYINYSPCYRCSKKIVGLMKSYLEPRQVSLQVVVASLYRISRPSCANRTTHAHRTYEDHDRNVRGLQSLQDAGVTLRTFNSQGMQDWNYLKQVLGAQGIQYRGSSRKSEDEDLRDDLEAVLEEDDSEDSFPRQVDGFGSSNPFHGQLYLPASKNNTTFQSRGNVRVDAPDGAQPVVITLQVDKDDRVEKRRRSWRCTIL